VDRPLLSLNTYSYPWAQAAAIAKIFDSVSIPYVLWGDHVLQYYGANQIILIAGFLIPQDELSRAIELMVAAGMNQCHCTQNVNHLTHPFFDNDVPAHFLNGLDYVFLATTDMVFDTVPLTDKYPNPLDLSFVTRRVALKAHRQYAHPTSCEEPIPAGEEFLQYYHVRFLDPRSLAILHTFLFKNEMEEKITRLGIGMSWRAIWFLPTWITMVT